MTRPKLHILFDGMARVYDRTEADALFESIEAEHASICDLIDKSLAAREGGMAHSLCLEEIKRRLAGLQ